MLIARGVLAGFFLVVVLGGCGHDPVSPKIDALLPSRGRAGDVVDVVGERFLGQEHMVSFGGQPAAVLFWQENRARVTVPSGPVGLTVVVVTVEGRPSNSADFYVEGGDGGR